MTNKELAADILRLVGGEGNVRTVVHCATRLRFSLKDVSQADTKALEGHPDVISVVQSGGQYQVVVGSHVNQVYKELTKLSGLGEGSSDLEENAESKNFFSRLIDVISGIFTPFLGAMAGAGVLKGFLTLAVTMSWLSDTSGTYVVLFAAADAIFNFLPFFLAFTAAKKFNTDPFIALSLAGALMHPGIVAGLAEGATLNFLGLTVTSTSYASSVLPIILAVFVQSYVERFFNKFVPQVVKIIILPLLVLLVMVPLTLIVLGPIGSVVGIWLGKMYSTIYNVSPTVTGFIMGGLWQVLVMFGMHWGFIPIALLNLSPEVLGYDTMLPMVLPAIFAQGAAAFAVFFKTKDAKMKALAASSTVTAIFGITEPTVYGVTLKLKKPFIYACLSGAIGGAIVGYAGVKNFVFGLLSIFSIPGFISKDPAIPSNVPMMLVACLIAVVLAFVLTMVLGFEDVPAAVEAVAPQEPVKPVTASKSMVLTSCLTGSIVPLKEVDDEAFSSGALGKGVAIDPTVGELTSPVSGEVTTVFPTGHAVGVTSNEGVEVLMHIGMNTVELQGEHFEPVIPQGAQVVAGDLLVKFDIPKIKAAGYSVITPMVVTNSNDYLDVIDLDQHEVVTNEACLTVVR